MNGQRPTDGPLRCRGAVIAQVEGVLGPLFSLVLSLVLLACNTRVESSTNEVSASSAPARATVAAGADGEPGLEVEVLSFNVRWDGFLDGPDSWAHRRDLVGRLLSEVRADSVGLQEPSERQVADILSIVPAYEAFTFEQSTQPILFRRQRFRLADAGGFVLFEGSWRPGSRRTCTWVRLEERSTGRAYYHFNVHLDHRSERSKTTSARRLVLGIRDREHPDPFVVTGDFNADEDSSAIRYLLGQQPLPDENGNLAAPPLTLMDTFRVAFPDAVEVGTFGGFVGKRSGVKIDYVLTEPGIHVAGAGIVHTESDGQYPSDHYPVSAKLRFEARARSAASIESERSDASAPPAGAEG